MTALSADNPFAQPSALPYQLPPFDRIDIDAYRPAFLAGMAQQQLEIEAIAAQPHAPRASRIASWRWSAPAGCWSGFHCVLQSGAVRRRARDAAAGSGHCPAAGGGPPDSGPPDIGPLLAYRGLGPSAQPRASPATLRWG